MTNVPIRIASTCVLTSGNFFSMNMLLKQLPFSSVFLLAKGGHYPWRQSCDLCAKYSTRISKYKERISKSDILKRGDVQPLAPKQSSLLAEQAQAAFEAWGEEDFPPKSAYNNKAISSLQLEQTVPVDPISGIAITPDSHKIQTSKAPRLSKPQLVIRPETSWVFSVPLLGEKTCIKVDTDAIITYGLLVDQKFKSYPSVTHILNETKSEDSIMALGRWRKRKIAELGEEGLNAYMREVKLTGKELHFCLETHFRGVLREDSIGSRVVGHWQSLKALLPYLSQVKVLESSVVHDQLQYKGFVDCVAFYKNTIVVVEWKTSQRNKSDLSSTYDDPIQMAAYIGAINQDVNYPFQQIENGLLAVCYATGAPADLHFLPKAKCEDYWQLWLQRLADYRQRKADLTTQVSG